MVEDATAADRGELVSVAEERDPGAGLVGEGEQGAGGVLVEHPGLVDDQQIAGPQFGCRVGVLRVADPVALVVPPPSVLVDQPRGRAAGGAGLPASDLGGLQRRGDHHQPMPAPGQQCSGGGEGGGLPGPGGTLDHEKRAVAGQGRHGGRLLVVEPGATVFVQPRELRRLTGPPVQPGEDVVLDLQHLPASVRDRTCSGTSSRASSGVHRPRVRAVMSSASSDRTAGSVTTLSWASSTSTSPRMSAAFQADRRAPSRERTHSAAWSRSIHPTGTGSRSTGCCGSR